MKKFLLTIVDLFIKFAFSVQELEMRISNQQKEIDLLKAVLQDSYPKLEEAWLRVDRIQASVKFYKETAQLATLYADIKADTKPDVPDPVSEPLLDQVDTSRLTIMKDIGGILKKYLSDDVIPNGESKIALSSQYKRYEDTLVNRSPAILQMWPSGFYMDLVTKKQFLFLNTHRFLICILDIAEVPKLVCYEYAANSVFVELHSGSMPLSAAVDVQQAVEEVLSYDTRMYLQQMQG
jgi:hypothetical protein